MSAKMASRKEPKIIPYSFEAIFLSDVIDSRQRNTRVKNRFQLVKVLQMLDFSLTVSMSQRLQS